MPALTDSTGVAPILVGFSGGGDSRALLQRALDTAEGQPVLAAIIDHGIRPDSRAEADRAADAARDAGAEAQVLSLNWPNTSKPSQAAARSGRMFALTTLAKQHGAREIFLGHTMDDQAETVLMRVTQGSGWRGLAGMAMDAPAPLWPGGRGLRLRRPLLNTRRQHLREALAARGIGWIEDPSNEAQRFLRVRARERLNAWTGGDLGVERWARLAASIAPLAAAVDGAARALITRAARFVEGTIALNRDTYRGETTDVRCHALATILYASSGSSAAADPDQLARLDEEIVRGQARGATLAGARYVARDNELFFSRDPGAVLGRAGVLAAPPEPLPVGEARVWDGRVAVTALEEGWEIVSGPDGTLPMLMRSRSASRLIIREAAERGVARVDWLLQERISHLLWR